MFNNKKNQGSGEALTLKPHREILIDLGLEKRYLKNSSNNHKSTGTALTRLENLVKHFNVSNTEKTILSFFLNLSPASIEKFANHLADRGKSPSTVYSTLIGLFAFE